MKIVAVDNFDRDRIPEHVEQSDLTPEQAKAECTRLNARCGPMADWFYVTRPDDAKVRTREDIYSPGD